MWKMICFLLFFHSVAIGNSQPYHHGPVLLSEIKAIPFNNPHSIDGKVQPGTTMKLSIIVKNIGSVPSPEGSIHLRFALPPPLDKNPKSVIYKSETVPLPSIAPNSQTAIAFATPHQWPTVADFIRNDWAMREYEVIATINDQEYITGTRAITFSAYYYESPQHERPAKIFIK